MHKRVCLLLALVSLVGAVPVIGQVAADDGSLWRQYQLERIEQTPPLSPLPQSVPPSSSLPPALAIDPVTREVVYIDNGEVRTITTIDDYYHTALVQTAQGPSVVTLTDPETVSLFPVDGNVMTFSVTRGIRMAPTVGNDVVYYYAFYNPVEPYASESFYGSTAIISIDLVSGVESANAGRALYSDGCSGMYINPPEHIIWMESGGLGAKRALERIATAGFDGFIGTLDACDRGVFAADFGAMEADAPRILSEQMQDWVVSPDGMWVAGTQFAQMDARDVVVVNVLTGEPIPLASGAYDRVAWLDNTTLIVGQSTPTPAVLSDVMTEDEAAIYAYGSAQQPNQTPVYEVKLVQLDLDSGEQSEFTDAFPDAYGFLRAYVSDDVIYAAIIPDGTAYATALWAAQATIDPDDDEAALYWLAPIIYAVDPETGTFEQVMSGYVRWTPFWD